MRRVQNVSHVCEVWGLAIDQTLGESFTMCAVYSTLVKYVTNYVLS